MNRAAIVATVLAVQTTSGMAQSDPLLAQASFIFDGERIEIAPNLPQAAAYASRFAALTPTCDPNCIVPQRVAEGVETVVELEVLAFLQGPVASNEGLLVDARMFADRVLGFIPGSVSLPHATLAQDNDLRVQILKVLDAREFEGVYNFADAQMLLVYDNGPSRNDAGVLVGHLLDVGYPPEKNQLLSGRHAGLVRSGIDGAGMMA